MCYCARAVTLVASPLVSWNFGEAWVRGMIFFFFFFFLRKKKKILFLTFNSNITCFIKVVFEESVKKRKRTRIKANCFGDRVQVEFMLLLQKTCLIVERA